jgi:hypothetical protein
MPVRVRVQPDVSRRVDGVHHVTKHLLKIFTDIYFSQINRITMPIKIHRTCPGGVAQWTSHPPQE